MRSRSSKLVRPGSSDAERQGRSRVGRGAERAEDAEQVSRVHGGLRARGDDQIVAGRLGVAAHAPRQPPGERVEPVDGRGELGEEERRPVGALHVGELVEEDDAAALDGPLPGGAAEHEERAQDPRRHRDRHGFALDELDAAGELQPASGGVPLEEPLDVADRPGLASDPAHARPADEEAEADGGRARDPGEEQEARPARPRGRGHRNEARGASSTPETFARRGSAATSVLSGAASTAFSGTARASCRQEISDAAEPSAAAASASAAAAAGRTSGRIGMFTCGSAAERIGSSRAAPEAERADAVPRGGGRAAQEEERDGR